MNAPTSVRLPSVALRALACLFALVALVAIPGCEQKLTQDNFDAITVGENGMTYDQVVRILGEGTKDEASGVSLSQYGLPGQASKKGTQAIFRWKEERREVAVTFQDGKAIDKNKSGF